jgi:hypothetical protein
MAQTKMALFYDPATNALLKIVLPHDDNELPLHLEPGQAMLVLDRQRYLHAGHPAWVGLINADNPKVTAPIPGARILVGSAETTATLLSAAIGTATRNLSSGG